MDKKALRKQLIQERLDLPDRAQRADLLQRVMVGLAALRLGARCALRRAVDFADRGERRFEFGERDDGLIFAHALLASIGNRLFEIAQDFRTVGIVIELARCGSEIRLELRVRVRFDLVGVEVEAHGQYALHGQRPNLAMV